MPNGADISQTPTIAIAPKDLPLCCPMLTKTLWNAHPRVYLALSDAGDATCPYCGTHYLLTTHVSHD